MRPKIITKPKFWLLKTLCGGALLGLFTYSLVTFILFEQAAVHVQGTVLKIEKESHATGRRGGHVTIERPLVKFQNPVSGQEVTATAKVLSSTKFSQGASIDLEFQPGEPAQTVRVAGGMATLDLAVGIIGLTLFAFGLAERWRYGRLTSAHALQKSATV